MTYAEGPVTDKQTIIVRDASETITIPIKDYVRLLTLSQKIADIAGIVRGATSGVPVGENDTQYISESDAILAIHAILAIELK